MRFSLLQLVELTAMIASGFAIDHITLLNGSGWMPAVLKLSVWGSIVGAYAGLRWSSKRTAAKISVTAAITAVIATFLNASRVGVSVAEDLRRAAYFEWSSDWPSLLGYICGVTLAAATLALLLALAFHALASVIARFRQPAAS
jgi:hypothetical protein